MDPSLICFAAAHYSQAAMRDMRNIGSGAAASRAVSSSARLLRGFGIFSHRGVGASPSPSNDG
jgi:hypothetical protein